MEDVQMNTTMTTTTNNDPINPGHYRISNNVQIIELIRLMPFSVGNAIKYCYRNGNKNNAVEDLKKALWYIKDYHSHVQTVNVLNADDILVITYKVLSGLNDWEKTVCSMIVELFIQCNSGNNSNELYHSTVEMIENKIAELSHNH